MKEWIIAADISSTRIKLQHVLQGVDLKGEHMPGVFIRHTGEDWESARRYASGSRDRLSEGHGFSHAAKRCDAIGFSGRGLLLASDVKG